MKENKRKIHHPDDNLFKKVMEDKTNAKAYLEEFYPELAKNLDLDRLQIQSESFLTPQFSAFKSDIIYRCPFKGSEEYMQYALLLWEHKSKPKKWVAIQLGLYIFLALDKMEKETGRDIEPIIPLLFYNGKEKWIPKTLAELFGDFEFYPSIKDFIPSFDFLFKNITGTPEADLQKLDKAFFRSAMYAMANRHNSDLLYNELKFIFEVEEDYQVQILFTYVVALINKTPNDIRTKLRQLDSSINNDKLMSTLEMLIKEGEEIGIKKGEKKERVFRSLVNLLKLIHKFPMLKVVELASFTEIKPEIIKPFLVVLKTKNKKKVQSTTNELFLKGITLSKSEKVKISKLITQVLKEKKEE